jgi:hypothetical protein
MNNQELIELVNLADSKSDIEFLVKQETGHDLDKRNGIDKMRAKAIELINGVPPVGTAQSEVTPNESGQAAVDDIGIDEALAAIASEPVNEPTEKPAPARRVSAGKRYLKRKGDARVYGWNSHMVKRDDMFLCTIDGELLENG